MGSGKWDMGSERSVGATFGRPPDTAAFKGSSGEFILRFSICHSEMDSISLTREGSK